MSVGILVLFLILRGNTLFSPLKITFVVGLLYMAFIILRQVPPMPLTGDF